MKFLWVAVLFVISVEPSLGMQSTRTSDAVQRLHRDLDARGHLPHFRSGKWGYIDQRGRTTIAPQFDEAGFFYDGRAAVRVNGLWGYIDATGAPVIPPRFRLATRFSNGLASVRWPDASTGTTSSGYVDTAGQVVIACEPGDPEIRLTAARCGRAFSEGLVAEAVEVFRCVDEPGNPKEYPCKGSLIDRWGYYDKLGRLAIAGPFHSGVSPLIDGLAAVARYSERAVGFIDASGSFVIAPKYEQALAFSEGLAAVRIGGLWGFIDRTARVVIEPRFQSPSSFSEGFATASLDGRRGYINRTGQFVISPQFQDAAAFSEGLAAVCCDGEETRYIDTAGRWAFEASFPRRLAGAGAFIEGIALVEVAGVGPAYIDRTGRVVSPVHARD